MTSARITPTTMSSRGPSIDDVQVDVFRFPTPGPEADGTLEWDATTAVTVRVYAGEVTGLGWTYSSPAAATVISSHFTPLLKGRAAHDVLAARAAMQAKSRNFGIGGLAMQAISAVDVALWDLKAGLFDVPLPELLGTCRDRVPVYGSGGFVSSDDAELSRDVAAWRAAGCRAMKIKIGRDRGARPDWDVNRVRLFRELAGEDVELMVDANGAYRGGEAIRVGTELERWNVRWFEEPVSSDDIGGLALARSALRCDVAAGEYVSHALRRRTACLGGGLSAGRRDEVRWLHRLSADGRDRVGAQPRDLGSLRAGVARACGCRGAQPASCGVVQRSRAARAGVARRGGAGRRRCDDGAA